MTSESLNEKLKKSIISGQNEEAEKTALEILKSGIDPLEIITSDLNPTMKLVGDKFERNECYLADLMLAAEAMKSAMGVLTPRIMQQGRQLTKLGKVVIGTVSGDIHDIGKNIVSMLLEVNGFEMCDLGKDVDSMKFIEKTTETQSDIIALSALMTTTKPSQKEVVDLLNAMGIRNRYKVMVGGAAITEKWAKQIGADGFGDTAEQAVRVAQELTAQK